MSSGWRDALRDALGLRLALWYAVIFVASALALVALTYVLLSASLRRYDRDTIETALTLLQALEKLSPHVGPLRGEILEKKGWCEKQLRELQKAQAIGE